MAPIAGEGDGAEMAAKVTTGLTDGLAKIDDIRVVGRQASRAPQADFIVSGELQKAADGAWEMRARMTRTETGEVVWAAPVSVAANDTELPLQQSRLVAGVGHPLALRINELFNSDARPSATDGSSPPGGAKVVIEQATASINQTTRERFGAAQAMLEKALAADPDNVDLAVALRGAQACACASDGLVYSPADSAAAEIQRQALSWSAPCGSSQPVFPVHFEAYCRFLTATNRFVDSLVACARTLSFDPWDGLALTHIGLDQLEFGTLRGRAGDVQAGGPR